MTSPLINKTMSIYSLGYSEEWGWVIRATITMVFRKLNSVLFTLQVNDILTEWSPCDDDGDDREVREVRSPDEVRGQCQSWARL